MRQVLTQVIQDARYAVRMLAKNPGFTFVVVLTLALGIGANAAIFSITDKVLLQSLPVQDPEQLTVLAAYDPKDGPDTYSSFSYPMYQDLRDRNDVFSGVITRGSAQMNVSYGDQTVRVRGELVSGNYFEVLGVRPWAGRLFTQDDDRNPGAHPVAHAVAAEQRRRRRPARLERARFRHELIDRAHLATARGIGVAKEEIRRKGHAVAQTAAKNLRYRHAPPLPEDVETGELDGSEQLGAVVVKAGGRVSDHEAQRFKTERIMAEKVLLKALERSFCAFAATTHLAQSGDARIGVDFHDSPYEPAPMTSVGVTDRSLEWN